MAARRSKKKFIGMPQIALSEQKVQEIWEDISAAIVLIQERRACRGMSFQDLYDKGNQLVTAQKIGFMYDSLSSVIKSHMIIVHSELKHSPPDNILQAVLEAYESHITTMQQVRDLLLMMDSKRNATRQSVLDLGHRLFVENVILNPPLQQRILDGMMKLIDGTRGGGTVNGQLLRATTSMLLDVGAAMGHNRTIVYSTVFLEGFLERTENFYRDASQRLQADNDVGVYLRWAHRTLEQERKLADLSLDGNLTVPRLLSLLRVELLEKYQADIIAAIDVQGMAESGDMEVLALVLRLFRNVKGGLKAVGLRVRQYITETCKKSIDAEDVKEGSKGAIKLVGVFCDLIGKFYSALVEKLDSISEFTHVLNTAFGDVINTHARICEYVSIFIDHSIRNHMKEQSADIEQVFDRAIRLFRLLREKDVFERYYKQHLARRLLQSRSTSDEAERMVISRLKAECGSQFTNRFEQMFKDIQISDDNMRGFKEATSGSTEMAKAVGKLDIDVRVLTTGMWPTQQSIPCSLPPRLKAATDAYSKWYLAKHTGRQLTWQTSLGTMMLQARFPRGNKLLSVSTQQGLLLLQFNGTDSPLSVAEIQGRTGMTAEQMTRSLMSLAKGKHKVLITSCTTSEISDSDTFEINNDFSAKMTKIKIAQGVAKESAPERKITQQRVDEDRRVLMEACIVRVLKSRKSLRHNELVIEVTKQLSARFQPTPQALKKRIERLIDADYLRRAENESSIYEYVA